MVSLWNPLLLVEVFDKGTPSPLISSFFAFKGLNGLIEKAVAGRHLEGFSLCKNEPKISHLLFVDDSLLFCHASGRCVKNSRDP